MKASGLSHLSAVAGQIVPWCWGQSLPCFALGGPNADLGARAGRPGGVCAACRVRTQRPARSCHGVYRRVFRAFLAWPQCPVGALPGSGDPSGDRPVSCGGGSIPALGTGNGGIVLLGRRLAELFSRRLPAFLAEGTAIAVAAQIACLPVLVSLSPTFSLYSVPANLLVAPLIPWITITGTVGIVVMMFWGPLARCLSGQPGFLQRWLE